MNLTKLKNYAPAARNAIITAVIRRAGTIGIQSGRVDTVIESGDVALIGGQPFPRSIMPLRKQLLDLIQREGFDHTMEAMAYTWFNRLVALRFMELHDGYLDHGYRVLSHPQGTAPPEILQHAEHVSLKGLDREEVIRLKLDGNCDEELYRLLLLAQCAELHHILPDVFSRLDDATILLLPDNLLHSDSVIRQLVEGSDAEDWQHVEVLGWLYQFYISEKKDAVMARKSAVPTEDIPAITQLFTPHWVVRYLVENSLGRLWLLNRPGSRLREHMPYYIECQAETDFLKISKPEEIKLVDPAVGSGHMLTYAFDLLTLIYEEEGYAPTEIPGLILRHNLHGLEICPRAAQLAELSLVFKAREKSRRFFQPEHLVRPRIIELQNVLFGENELRGYIHALGLGDLFNQPMLQLLHQFQEAKNFGSLIQPCLNEAEVQNVRLQIQNSESHIQNSSDQLFLRKTHLKVLRVLEQAEALTQRYHVVVANPPYVWEKRLNPALKVFLGSEYTDFRSNLFAAFFARSGKLVQNHGQIGFMTPNVWMFLSSYEGLRMQILRQSVLQSLIQLENSAFEGAAVAVCAFVTKSGFSGETNKGVFIRLCDFKGSENQGPKALEAIKDSSCAWRHSVLLSDFSVIPGEPLAYWIGSKFRNTFRDLPPLDNFAEARQGLATGDNEMFLRCWHEVEFYKFKPGCTNRQEASESGGKWFPYNKGGPFRKWYGNQDFVLNWENDGRAIKEKKAADVQAGRCTPNNAKCWNQDYYFRSGLSWSGTGIETFGARFAPDGFVFDVKGSTCFVQQNKLKPFLAFFNSVVPTEFLKILNPTTEFQAGNIKQLPLCAELNADIDATDFHLIADKGLELTKIDWDNFETSWDFHDQPLLRPGLKGATLDASWRNWEAQSTATTLRMQELEMENNRLFIAAYGLEGELQPEVPEAQITLFCNPASRYKRKVKKKIATEEDSEDDGSDPESLEKELSNEPDERLQLFRADTVREFLSYAVGCMMGRYSLDAEGLILANAAESLSEFIQKVGKPLTELTFVPDEDGIIPVLDGEWFEDDIVARAKEFLRATFGETSLNENLRFIEESLGKDLRTYLLSDFYKDHLQTYKNRPIYWQLCSGKQKAFQCLVYFHRYTPATLARIRTEYAIPLQGKLSARISRLEEDVIQTASSAARKKHQTDLDKCKKQIVELLAFDDQLRSYADKAITLDLDDGVKANYAKFGTLVAEAKKICGTKDD